MCSNWYKNTIENTIYEVIVDGLDIHDAIIKTKSRNLSIIPAYLNLAGVQVEFFEMERKFAEQNIKFSKVLRLKEELYKIKESRKNCFDKWTLLEFGKDA